jgi:pyruvate dehydrogenase E2 component (dihydrolipoamide acetyltransferase)
MLYIYFVLSVSCPFCKVEDVEDIKSIPADTSFGGEQKEEQSTESAPQNKVVNVTEQSSTVSRISPAAKLLIKEHGLDTSSLRASGPRGTLLKGDVLAALKSGINSSSTKEKKSPAQPSSQPTRDSQSQASSISQKDDTYEDIPNSQIRKVPCLTLLISVDIPNSQMCKALFCHGEAPLAEIRLGEALIFLTSRVLALL